MARCTYQSSLRRQHLTAIPNRLLICEQAPSPGINGVANEVHSQNKSPGCENRPSNTELVTPPGDFIETSEAQLPVTLASTSSLALHTPTSLSRVDTADMMKQRSQISPENRGLLRKFLEKVPYPSGEQKADLAAKVGMNQQQVSNWFANARRREPSVKRNPNPEPLVGTATKSEVPTLC